MEKWTRGCCGQALEKNNKIIYTTDTNFSLFIIPEHVMTLSLTGYEVK